MFLPPNQCYLSGLSSPQLGQHSDHLSGDGPQQGARHQVQEDKEVLGQFSSPRIEKRSRYTFHQVRMELL